MKRGKMILKLLKAAERRTKAQKKVDRDRGTQKRLDAARIRRVVDDEEREMAGKPPLFGYHKPPGAVRPVPKGPLTEDDIHRIDRETYNRIGSPLGTPQGLGRALRQGKQNLGEAQRTAMDRRVADLVDEREAAARKKDAKLDIVRRRNEGRNEPPTPVNAFLKAFGVHVDNLG